jgi:hypothetical protein
VSDSLPGREDVGTLGNQFKLSLEVGDVSFGLGGSEAEAIVLLWPGGKVAELDEIFGATWRRSPRCFNVITA